MPRANDISKWRRIAMQAIMWIILAGTIGLAALVDARVAGTRNALGPTLTIGGNVRLQLPAGWIGAEDDESFIEARESNDQLARAIRVKLGPPNSLFESIRALANADA